MPAANIINKNFMVANYGPNGGCIDNDDGSSFYNITSNFFVFGPSKKKNQFIGPECALEDTDGVLCPAPLTGVGAPHQCPLGKLAMLPSLCTDVRSILMIVLVFKGRASCRESDAGDADLRA